MSCSGQLKKQIQKIKNCFQSQVFSGQSGALAMGPWSGRYFFLDTFNISQLRCCLLFWRTRPEIGVNSKLPSLSRSLSLFFFTQSLLNLQGVFPSLPNGHVNQFSTCLPRWLAAVGKVSESRSILHTVNNLKYTHEHFYFI